MESAERLLVDTARDTDPARVALAARHLATGRTCSQGPTIGEGLDQDGPEPDEREPARRMELRLGRRDPRTGLTLLTGTLDDETVEVFRQVTDPLTTPAPAVDGVKDARPPAVRLAQAHAAVLRRCLDAGTGPSGAGRSRTSA